MGDGEETTDRDRGVFYSIKIQRDRARCRISEARYLDYIGRFGNLSVEEIGREHLRLYNLY